MVATEDRSIKFSSFVSLYLARKLEKISSGRQISVLDFGCGNGETIKDLAGLGYDLYGCELEDKLDRLRNNLSFNWGNCFQHKCRIAKDERSIPFADNSFDVVYANQALEHVKFFDSIFCEFARVLKPDGVLFVNFPLATVPIEWHLKIPFAHWIPPGRIRVRYLQLFFALKLRPKIGSYSAFETAVRQDEYLTNRTFYRFMNEVQMVSRSYFQECSLDTQDYLDARFEMMGKKGRKIQDAILILAKFILGGKLLSYITHFFNAAFCFRIPVKG